MYKNSITIVIPAYNEQDNLKKIVDKCFNFLKSNFQEFEVIVVDDGSFDSTPIICNQLIDNYNGRFVALRHGKNRGYGAALRTGLFSAKGDLVFYTDADNQFDIDEINNHMKYISDYDVVIGYRKNRKDKMRRKFAALVYNRLIFLLFGLNVRDIDCSFKLFKRRPLHSLSIDSDKFLVDTELLVKSKINNFKIKEVPVTHFPRIAGKSCIRFSHVFTTLNDIRIFYYNFKCNNKL